ncbi:Lysine-specific demethylase 5A [Cichlidogyrus casuarinus]|uniref:Lysine-specific demethylase 5A n=1 Tax=Cichlidogyrus casuarinus TaxID=1844966 RepID=A0ABD2QA56_9PLAT
MGRECVDHYITMRRQCVFSNEELLCTLASVFMGEKTVSDIGATIPPTVASNIDHNAGLDVKTAQIVLQELQLTYDEEKFLRNKFVKTVKASIRWPFPDLDDDARTCLVCQTTLFLSAIGCECKISAMGENEQEEEDDDDCIVLDSSPTRMRYGPKRAKKDDYNTRMVCLKHANDLCDKCPISVCTLYYYCTLEELEQLIKRLQNAQHPHDSEMDQLNRMHYVLDEFRHCYDSMDPSLAIEANFTIEAIDKLTAALKTRKYVKADRRAMLTSLQKYVTECRKIINNSELLINALNPQEPGLVKGEKRWPKFFLRYVRKLSTDQDFTPSLCIFESNVATCAELYILELVIKQNTRCLPEMAENKFLNEILALVPFEIEWLKELTKLLKHLKIRISAGNSFLNEADAKLTKFISDYPSKYTELFEFKNVSSKVGLVKEAMSFIKRTDSFLDLPDLKPMDLASICAELSSFIGRLQKELAIITKSCVPDSFLTLAENALHTQAELDQGFASFSAVLTAKLQSKLGRLNELRCQLNAQLTILLETFNCDYSEREESAISELLEELRGLKIKKLTCSPKECFKLQELNLSMAKKAGENDQLSPFNDVLDAVFQIQQACKERIIFLLDQRGNSVIPLEIEDTFKLIHFLFATILVVSAPKQQPNPEVDFCQEWVRLYKSISGLKNDVTNEMSMLRDRVSKDMTITQAHNYLIGRLMPNSTEKNVFSFIKAARSDQEAATKIFNELNAVGLKSFVDKLLDETPCEECSKYFMLTSTESKSECKLCELSKNSQEMRISRNMVIFDLSTRTPLTMLIRMQQEIYQRLIDKLTEILSSSFLLAFTYDEVQQMYDVKDLPTEVQQCIGKFRKFTNSYRPSNLASNTNEIRCLHQEIWPLVLFFPINETPLEQTIRVIFSHASKRLVEWPTTFKSVDQL